jgi:chromosome segregation ATPase
MKKPSAAFALFCICSLLSSQVALPQGFSSIDTDLLTLESLINGTIANMEEQQQLLEDLKKNLSESGTLIESYERIMSEREASLRNLQAQLTEMSETYRRQSALLTNGARSRPC